jgi:hypothetical protein
MILTVQSIAPPKPGGRNYSVSATNGERYSTNAPGIEQTTGKSIDAVVGSFTTRQGKQIPTIESFTVVEQARAIASQQQTDAAPWWWPSVSNVWAHAIQSGLVKAPEDLKQWSAAVKSAAEDITIDEPDF